MYLKGRKKKIKKKKTKKQNEKRKKLTPYGVVNN